MNSICENGVNEMAKENTRTAPTLSAHNHTNPVVKEKESAREENHCSDQLNQINFQYFTNNDYMLVVQRIQR